MFPEVIKNNILEPQKHDVLCGRGGGSQHHAGNKEFRDVIALNKWRYINASLHHKKLLVDSIVTAVRLQNPPGRFLERDSKTGLWNDIGYKRAVVKTSQALREGAPKLRLAMVNEPKQHGGYARKHAPTHPKRATVRMATTSNKKVPEEGLDVLLATDAVRSREEMETAKYESQFNELVSSDVVTVNAPNVAPTALRRQDLKAGVSVFSDSLGAPPAHQEANIKSNSVRKKSNFNLANEECVRSSDAPTPVTVPSSVFETGEIAESNVVTPFPSMVFHQEADSVASDTLQMWLHRCENAVSGNADAIDALTRDVVLSQNEMEQNVDDLCDFNDFLEGISFGTAQSDFY